MKKSLYIAALGLTLTVASCDGLDQYPTIEDSSDKVYSSVDGFKSVMAACYASYSYNVADLNMPGKNEPLIRSIFNLQEGTTDAIAYTWLSGDQLGPLTYNTWNASDVWCEYVWYRCYVVVTSCNDLLKNAAGRTDEEIRQIALEARFLRALSLSYIMDLYGKGVLPTENTSIGETNIPTASRQELYAYITSELEAIAPEMSATVAYPRASQGAAYALLSRIYLNSEVYNGTKDFDKCIAAAKKVKSIGYQLEPNATYHNIFGADNHNYAGPGKEIIFALASDAENARSWAGATNIICGFGKSGGENNEQLGISAGWSNMRVNGRFSALFNETGDIRNTFFYTDGQSQYITTEDDKDQGYISLKFTNLTDDGKPVYFEGNTENGCATDLPIIRYAEVILNEAEAQFRSGNEAEAIDLINQIRKRAGALDIETISEEAILNERGRELAFEMLRRTDLVRFNKYGGNVDYNWEFKGGAAEGKNFEAFRNVFPIPGHELSANANLTQNEGY